MHTRERDAQEDHVSELTLTSSTQNNITSTKIYSSLLKVDRSSDEWIERNVTGNGPCVKH